MADRTIEIEENPANGRLVSNTGYGALIDVSGVDLGDAPPVVIYQDWGDNIVGISAAIVPEIGIKCAAPVSNIIASWGSAGVGSRSGVGANDRIGLNSFVFPSPLKNFYASCNMSIPSGYTFSGASAPNVTPFPLTSALKLLWLIDGDEDKADKADVIIGTWTSAAFQMLGNQSGTTFNGSGVMDFAGWNYFAGYCVAGADPYTQGEWQYQMTNANLPNTIWNKSAPAFQAGMPAQYTRANIIGWSGTNNGNDPATSMHVSEYVYVAASDTDSVKSRIEITNNATFSLATKCRPIPPDIWTTTSIKKAVPQHIVDQGFTHYRITTNTGQTIDGAL